MSKDLYSSVFDCRPILSVANVDSSLTYYQDVLGFRVGWRWSNDKQAFLSAEEPGPAHTALVGLGHAQLMLVEGAQGQRGMWLHFDVQTADDLEALHSEWVQRGALLLEPPSIRPWGMYEFRVKDLDEHTFRLSAPPREE